MCTSFSMALTLLYSLLSVLPGAVTVAWGYPLDWWCVQFIGGEEG